MKRAILSRRAGFTLIEILIAATILLVMAGSLITALEGLSGVATAGSVEANLQESGERAMARIRGDLTVSGFLTAPALANQGFPFTFEDGDPSLVWTWNEDPTVGKPAPPWSGMAAHAHPVAAKHGQAGDPDFGPNREIVFLQPADADNDGIPDLDPNGALVWDADQFSYVVVTRPDGNNYLERRVNGANPTSVARHVERILFHDNYSDALLVPEVNVVLVQIFFRQIDSDGHVHRYTTQAKVRLRNASIAKP